jgi:hypothetical protein
MDPEDEVKETRKELLDKVRQRFKLHKVGKKIIKKKK